MEFTINNQEAEKIFGQQIANALDEVEELKKEKQHLLYEARKREIYSRITSVWEICYCMENTKETAVEGYLRQLSSDALCSYISIAKDFGFELTNEVMLEMMQKEKKKNEDN